MPALSGERKRFVNCLIAGTVGNFAVGIITYEEFGRHI
jgi:hypothetical protein